MERFLANTSLSVAATSMPFTLTIPLSGISRRPITESKVDLPAPLGPMIEVIPPR